MTATLLAMAIVVVQIATGAAWWALIRRRGVVSLVELLGMGVALGTFGAMLFGIVLVTTPLASLGWLVPTAVAAVVLAIAWRRGALSGLQVTAARSELLAGVAGLLVGLLLLAGNWARVPLVAPPTDSYADLYFFEAISKGLAEFGPAQSILMVGGSLRYHWFTYGWAGDLAQNAGTAPFVVMTRILPIVTLIGATALAAAWAGKLSKVRWVPTLAVLLIVAGGYSGALYGSILNFDSPSQALTTVWLLGFGLVFVGYLTERAGWPWLVALAALAVACTGGKVSHALVALGGAGLTVIVGIATRAEWWRRSFVATIVAGVFAAGTYLLVLSGVAVSQNLTETIAVKASTWQGLDPLVGPLGVVLGTLALALAIFTRLAGIGWLVSRPRWRADPSTLFAIGGLAIGLIAMLLLREGVNELWFVLAASGPAAVLSAVGVGAALAHVRATERDGRLGRPLVWAVLVAAPATAACLLLTRNWSAHQHLLNWLAPVAVWVLVPCVAVIVVLALGTKRSLSSVVALSVAALTLTSIATRPSSAWTATRPITTEVGPIQPVQSISSLDPVPVSTAPVDPVPWAQRYAWWSAGAEWLVANTPEESVVATSEPLSNVVPALSGRTMFLAGQRYQTGLGRADEIDEVGVRAMQSRVFSAEPSRTTAAPLCAQGVDYAWLERSPDPFPTDAVLFVNDGITIVSLAGWACD